MARDSWITNVQEGVETSVIKQRYTPSHCLRWTWSLAILLSGLTSTLSWAQLSEHQWSLHGFLASKGLNTSQVRSVQTVLGPTSLSWSKGIVGEVDETQFILQSQNAGSEGVGYSLKFSYNAILQQAYRLELCYPLTPCEPLDLSMSGRSSHFMADGIQWRLKTYGVPCRTQTACDFKILSWALQQRFRAGNGTTQSIPSSLAIVDYAGGLALLDSATGKVWMDLRRPAGSSLERLGTFTKAELTDQGRLILAGTLGAIVVDFPKDRVLLITNQGIEMASAGVGGLDQAHFSWVYQRDVMEEAGVEKSVLLVRDRVVVWRDGYLRLELNREGDDVLASPFLRKEDEPLELASWDAQSDQLWALSRINGEIIRRVQLAREGQQAFTYSTSLDIPKKYQELPLSLIGSSVFLISPDGVFLLQDNQVQPTALAADQGLAKLFATGDVWSRVNRHRPCYFQHFQQHSKVDVSFQETQLTADCAKATSFNATPFGVTVTTHEHGMVTIKSLRRRH